MNTGAFSRWTIGQRILAAGAAVIALFLLVGVIAGLGFSRLESYARDRLRDDTVPGAVYMGVQTENAMRAHNRLVTAGIFAETDKRQQSLRSASERLAECEKAMAQYEAAITNDEDRRNFATLKERRAAYLVDFRKAADLLTTPGHDTEARAFIETAIEASWNSYRGQLVVMTKWNNDAIIATANAMVATAHRTLLVTAGSTGAILLVAAALGALIIRSTNRALRNIAGQLSEASSQVSSAADQVSSASQGLAQGSSEQAASVEETSASLEEISSMVKRNAENADHARGLSSDTAQATDAGAQQMQQMVTAMSDIKSSSDNIAKIIKTIDEIAFQTNILALNAAVEAARAGEAGAGFAVVADEVRALAQRAAQAAKDTAEKIDDSIGKSNRGAEISAKVAEVLEGIATKGRSVNKLVVEIADASKEQSQGLGQINTALSQMDKVTQSNASSAEETASAAEELNAQALSLKGTVDELMQLVDGSRRATPSDPTAVERPVVAAKSDATFVTTLHADSGKTLRPVKPAPASRGPAKKPVATGSHADFFHDS